MFEMAQNDYLRELLQNIQRQLDGHTKTLEDQTKTLGAIKDQTTKTNGKVIRLREDVDSLQSKAVIVPKKGFVIPNIPAPVLYLLALAAVILLIIIAWTFKIDLSGILR